MIIRKLIFMLLFFCSLESYSQGYFQWSSQLVSGHWAASGGVLSLDGSDFLRQTTSSTFSLSSPPTVTTSLIKLNGNYSNGITWPTNILVTQFQADFENHLYLDDLNGTIIKYDSALNIISSFQVMGQMKDIDENGFLYTYDNNILRRYDTTGLFIDEVLMPNMVLKFRENGTYCTVDSLITYYQFPNTIISQILNPVWNLTLNLGKTSRNLSYFVIRSSIDLTHFSVYDSTGQLFYSVNASIQEIISNGFDIDNTGQLIIVKRTSIEIYNQSGLLNSLSLKLPNSGVSSNAIIGCMIARGNSIYYSGKLLDWGYQTNQYGVVEIYVPPNYLYTNTGSEGSSSAYVAFAGKLSTGIIPDSVSFLDFTPPSALCAENNFTLNIKTSVFPRLNYGQTNTPVNFYAEISDSTGSFNAPVKIGEGFLHIINCSIPDSLPVSNGYKIRIHQIYPPGGPKVQDGTINLKRTPENQVTFYDGAYGVGNVNQQIPGFYSCGPVTGIISSSSPDITYSWRNLSNGYSETILSTNDSVINNLTNATNNSYGVIGVVTDTVSGCPRKSKPVIIKTGLYNPPTISANGTLTNDTIITCIDNGPIPILYNSNSYYEITGLLLSNQNSTYYFYPDSLGIGWHKLKMSVLDCNATCGPCNDSLMIYVDSCNSSIATGIINNGTTLCYTDTIWVPFTTNAVFDSTNIFQVLDSQSGQILGSGFNSPIPFINNSQYYRQVRIKSTSPSIIGSLNSDGPFRSYSNNPNFDLTVNGTNNLCAQTGSVISKNVISGHIQFLRDGIVIIDTIVTSPSSYYFTYTASVNGVYQLLISPDILGCMHASKEIRIVDASQIPNSNIFISSGSSPLCLPDSLQLAILQSPNCTYQWFNYTTPIPNTIDTSISVSMAGSYYCIVSNNTCSVSSNVIYVDAAPTFSNISTSYTGCQASGASLYSGTSYVNQIQWYLNDTIIPGSNSVFLQTYSPGTYHATIVDSNGCVGSTPKRDVTIINQPTISISPSDTISACSENWVTINLNFSSTLFAIKWYRDGNLIESNGSSSIIAAGSGIYYAVASFLPGACYAYSDSVFINYIPSADMIINSSSNVLCGADSVLLSVSNVPSTTWQWFLNGIAIPNSNLNAIYTTIAGNYSVTSEHILGCERNSDTATIVNSNPVLAQTTALGSTSFCAGDSVILQADNYPGYSFQWLRNQLIIPQANYSDYPAKIGGNYSVLVTNSSGCTNISSPIIVSVPCVPLGDEVEKNSEETNIENQFSINIYPNPAGEFLNIIVNSEKVQGLSYEITDLTGRKLQARKLDLSEGLNIFNISLSNFSEGKYLLKLFTLNKVKVLNFIKSNTK